MNENEIAEIFDGLEFTIDDVRESNKKWTQRARMDRDPSICSCGHPKNRHHFLESRGHWSCQPSKMSCNCRHLEIVLEAQDSRHFVMKTMGPGPDHALQRAIEYTLGKGKGVKWVGTGKTCFVCKDAEKKTTIVGYKMVGEVPVEVADEGGQKNRFMCRECRDMISMKRYEGGLRGVPNEEA